MLFKPYRNESELLQENETSRDAFMRQMDSLDTDSAPYLNMAQEIQLAIVRIQLLLKAMKMVHEQSKKTHWILVSLGHKHSQEL